MDTDNQLLTSYARHQSEGAFRELVERHINLVHSAALRESRGNASLAEELTQAVFTELARVPLSWSGTRRWLAGFIPACAEWPQTFAAPKTGGNAANRRLLP